MKNLLPGMTQLVMFGMYTGLVVTAVFHHEPWRDEAQAWLIARDLPLEGIFRQMAYEGTPALWHLFIVPLAKLGVPYASILWLNAAIAIGGGFLIIYRSPFSITTKCLLIFSYYLFWEYAVIARSYGLSVLLLLAIGTMYERRFSSPYWFAALVFLLFNTNVHSFFIAVAIGGVYWYEWSGRSLPRMRRLLPVLIVAAGAVGAVCQLISPPDNRNYGLFTIFSWETPFFVLADAFFPALPRTGYVTLIVGCLLFSICGLYFLARSKTVFSLFIASCAGLFYIFVFKHTGSLRHHGFVLMLVVFCLWVCQYYDDGLDFTAFFREWSVRWLGVDRLAGMFHAGINLALLVSIPPAFAQHVQEYRAPFSGSKAMAQYLSSQHLETRPIAAFPSHVTSAVLPYLNDVTFWYADVRHFGTYVTWNTAFQGNHTIPVGQALGRIEAEFSGRSDELVLLGEPIPLDRLDGYIELFRVEKGVFGHGEERYYLYARKNDGS